MPVLLDVRSTCYSRVVVGQYYNSAMENPIALAKGLAPVVEKAQIMVGGGIRCVHRRRGRRTLAEGVEKFPVESPTTLRTLSSLKYTRRIQQRRCSRWRSGAAGTAVPSAQRPRLTVEAVVRIAPRSAATAVVTVEITVTVATAIRPSEEFREVRPLQRCVFRCSSKGTIEIDWCPDRFL